MTSAWAAFRRGFLIGETCFSSSRVANLPASGETGRSTLFAVARGRLARLASALRFVLPVLDSFDAIVSTLLDCDA